MKPNDRDETQALAVQFSVLTAGFLSAFLSDADVGILTLLILILVVLVLIYPMTDRLRARMDAQHEMLLKQSVIASVAAAAPKELSDTADAEKQISSAVQRSKEIERAVSEQLEPETRELLAKEKAEAMNSFMSIGFLLYVTVLCGLAALVALAFRYVIEAFP